MAGHPLRPATRRSHGRPLPHHQADRPRAHPPPKNFPPQPMRAEVISGINHRFRWLSQSGGQITHVLLTRSPLEYHRSGLSARLACVKHAASVRPEPGSNSPSKTNTHTNQKASMRKREPHPLTFRHNTNRKILSEIIVLHQRNHHHNHTQPPKRRARQSHGDGAKQTNSSTMTHC